MYDLETTGLAYSGKKIDIIERHFEEYSTSIEFSSGLLKPVYVPFIPFEITNLTGINKEMVYEYGSSFDDFKKEIDIILKYCNKPIFIAHNGNSFDHKILIERNILNHDKCILLDSKVIIRLFLNDPITNKGLSDIFKYLFGFIPTIHRAKSDVKMLISIFEKLNITKEKILKLK
jgi:DNA polymerase III epsilon subunit-like protein